MEKLEKLLDTAIEQYQDGFPLHLSDPTWSAIALMSATDFGQKSAGKIQDVLQMKHILILDCEKDTTFKFDKAGLDTLCLSMHSIEVQGKPSLTPYWYFFSYLCSLNQSVHVGKAGTGELWLTTATTGQLLEAAHASDGKILNALEFQMGLASLDPPPKF